MLGFLTNLRDIKSSLVSGMILLFTLWIVFGNAMMKVPHDDTITGNLTRIASYLGTPGTLAVLTFIAYIIGMVATTHGWLNIVEGFAGGKVAKSVSKSTADRFSKFLHELVDDALKKATPNEIIAALKLKDQDEDFEQISRLPEGEQRSDMKALLPLHLDRYVQNDLRVLAAQLHMNHDKTWEKYDKASSEADFRAGMVIPLVLLMTALSWRIASENNWGLMYVEIGFLLVVQLILVLKAASKRQEANEEIIHAIVNGKIDVTPIETLKETIKPPSAQVSVTTGV